MAFLWLLFKEIDKYLFGDVQVITTSRSPISLHAVEMIHQVQSVVLLLCALILAPAGCFAQDVSYGFGETSEAITEDETMQIRGIRNRINKDFVIGGVLGVHRRAGSGCGVARSDQSVESMLFAIDSVNADESLLPNITLGFDIRDTCYSENIALDEMIDVIISGNQLNVAGCQSTNMGSTNASIIPTVGIVHGDFSESSEHSSCKA